MDPPIKETVFKLMQAIIIYGPTSKEDLLGNTAVSPFLTHFMQVHPVVVHQLRTSWNGTTFPRPTGARCGEGK
jgi:hypothetical protein